MNRAPHGFTLLEILTAVVVVGVLFAIAIPTWQTHALRVRRADATDALLALQRAQDAWFGRHARYASPAQMTVAAPAGLGLNATSAHGWYTLELTTSADGLAFRASATAAPAAGQSRDSRCARFTIDQLGQRRATDDTGRERNADCWH